MKGFFMLAGTVLTHLDLKQLAELCSAAGMKPVFDDDEFSIEQDATLTVRQGFDHELLLVGDAGDLAALQTLTQRISMILANNKIAHAYELYDPIDRDPIDRPSLTPSIRPHRSTPSIMTPSITPSITSSITPSIGV